MPTDEARLSQIATRWSLLLQAHHPDAAVRLAAQAELLPRYCAPVYRYLFGLVRDAGAAEELCQEFALRFLRGDFRHADSSRGRFRDYLKTALVHLAGEHRRRCGRVAGSADANSGRAVDESDRFDSLWRSELLDRTWAEMAKASAAKGDDFFDVLRLKCDGPACTSAELADEFTRRKARPVTADSVRQTLRRARLRFAELLRAEVAASLPTVDPDAVNAELAELGLLVYCPPVG